MGRCRLPVCPGPVLLAWCSKFNEAHVNVTLPKPHSVLFLIVLSFETQFFLPCPLGFKQQNFSC